MFRFPCQQPAERRHLWRSILLILLLSSPLTMGCGGQHVVHAVDPTEARATLQQVLQSWKEGKPIEWWREQDPEVVVQDFDWSSGAKLEDFAIAADDKAVDANLYCTVELTLADSKRGSTQREVTYLVSTQPKLTVFRQVMP